MRVFVTGATGFIGSAIVQELIGAGHQVLGLARSETAAASLRAVGAEVHRGALDDLNSLRRGAEVSEGVIHAAFVHDFSNYATSAQTDRQAVEALGTALLGSGRPFVVTSVTALLTPGRLRTEEDAPDPTSVAAPRIASEQTALALASQGVRVCIVRLPPSVHGEGDRAFVPTLIGVAREKGVSAYVGEGQNRWPAVHRLDVAHLYRLAWEKGTAGLRVHGVADEGVLLRDLAEVIGQRLNVPIVSLSPEEATAHFGWLAHFLTVDNPTSSARTQEGLGWHPVQPTLLSDLDQPHYFV